MYIQGKVVKVKLVRWGFPTANAKVLDTSLALYGSMKVELENGERAIALYPPLEVLGDSFEQPAADQLAA